VLGVDFLRGEDGRGLLVSGGLDRDIRVWVEDHDGDEGKLQNGEKEDHPLGDKAVPPVDGAKPPRAERSFRDGRLGKIQRSHFLLPTASHEPFVATLSLAKLLRIPVG